MTGLVASDAFVPEKESPRGVTRDNNCQPERKQDNSPLQFFVHIKVVVAHSHVSRATVAYEEDIGEP